MWRKIVSSLVAVSFGLLAASPAAAEARTIFRYKTSLVQTQGPGTTDPETPEEPAGPTEPTHYRVMIDKFHGGGSIADVAFVEGPRKIPPKEANVSGQEVPEVFDDNPTTGWNSANPSVEIVYSVENGKLPDALELTALQSDGPTQLRIDKSYNGQSWIPIVSYVDEPVWSPGEKRRYPFSVTPPAAGGSAHKFWRVAVEKFTWAGSYTGVAEITYKSPSGVDVTYGGRYGSDHGNFNSALYDKNPSKEWMSDHRDSRPATFWYEFDTPQEIGSVDVTASGWSKPEKIRIDSSDDGKVWTARAYYIGQGGWTNGETRNYPLGFIKPLPGYHQFWRISIHKSNRSDNRGILDELRFFAEGGTEIQDKAVPIASSEYYDADNANDRRNWNPWLAEADDETPWIGYVFPEPVKAESLAIWAESSSSSPREFSVEWSDDGLEWTSTVTHRGNGSWSSYERRDFSVHPEPSAEGAHRFWRVAVDTVGDFNPEYVSLRELDFLADDGASLTGKGVPISGSAAASHYTAAEAFDRIWSSGFNYFWKSVSLPDWVGYEFPKAVKPKTATIIANGWNAPRDFHIQWSDNGEVWTTSASYVGHGRWETTTEVPDLRTFDVSHDGWNDDGHHFWRILVYENNSTSRDLQIGEIEFVGKNSPSWQYQGDPIASDRTPSNEEEYAFIPDETYQMWEVDRPTQDDPQWIGYYFPRPTVLDHVAIKAYRSDSAPKRFDIQWSDDGVNWVTQENYSGVGRGSYLLAEDGFAKFSPHKPDGPRRYKIVMDKGIPPDGGQNRFGMFLKDVVFKNGDGQVVPWTGVAVARSDGGEAKDAHEAFMPDGNGYRAPDWSNRTEIILEFPRPVGIADWTYDLDARSHFGYWFYLFGEDNNGDWNMIDSFHQPVFVDGESN